MSKKTTTKDKVESKQPKTVRVSTLVKIAVSIAALATAFGAGTYTANTYQAQYNEAVKETAEQLVTDLKSSK